MNRVTKFCAALALIAASAATFAADTSVTTPTAEKPKTKLICKLEKPVGSQMVKRVCMTQDQADFLRTEARRELSTPSKR